MTTDNRTNGQIVAKALVAHCEEHKMPFPRGSVKKIVEALRVAGRLAGEPTETQVEAAVHAAWAKSREFRGVGGQAEFAPPWEFQQVIRAALEAAARAAQGAAPARPVIDREKLIDVLVMTDLSDYAGSDMRAINQCADAILAHLAADTGGQRDA